MSEYEAPAHIQVTSTEADTLGMSYEELPAVEFVDQDELAGRSLEQYMFDRAKAEVVGGFVHISSGVSFGYPDVGLTEAERETLFQELLPFLDEDLASKSLVTLKAERIAADEQKAPPTPNDDPAKQPPAPPESDDTHDAGPKPAHLAVPERRRGWFAQMVSAMVERHA